MTDELVAAAARLRAQGLRGLFAADPERGTRLHAEAAGWYLDYAKHLVDDEVMRSLVARAQAVGLRTHIDAMFAGEHVNVTEDRPVLHVALRMPEGASLVVDGVDVVAEVHAVLRRMAGFADAVRNGDWRGHTGRPIRNIVNIGIGGSDLGPAMAYEALQAYSRRDLQFRFVSNVDGADLVEALHGLDAAETLFIVSSKTFTTLETLTNARSARDWLVRALGGETAAVSRHFVAVSTNAEEAAAFGIDPAHMFVFWDWVGGRYSVWSAIGLSLMVAIGPGGFTDLLAGAHSMDQHFRTAPFGENLPVLMALLADWSRTYLDAQTHVVVPYAQLLARFPAYLQQLEMESTGKSVRADGTPVTGPTGGVVWGTPGTDGQHAYFQLLHQGTVCAPVDFVGFIEPQPGHLLGRHHELLVANMLAQAEALAFGTDDPALPPWRVMPGDRPSCVLVAQQCTPFALGALIAAYEHKVGTLGALWGIDAYDQWGVELGKVLGVRIAAELAGEGEPGRGGAHGSDGHDSSTATLIRRYRDRSP